LALSKQEQRLLARVYVYEEGYVGDVHTLHAE
jgi:hypothetical protein